MKTKIKFVRDRKNPYNVFTPENATKLLIKELGEEDVEHTGFIALNASNEVLGIEVLTVGTVSQAPFNCAGMFRIMFQKKEYNIINSVLLITLKDKLNIIMLTGLCMIQKVMKLQQVERKGV